MERVAFVMRVKEGEEEEYRQRHQRVWPAVLAYLGRGLLRPIRRLSRRSAGGVPLAGF